MSEATEYITDATVLQQWRSPQSIKPTRAAKDWARKSFDITALDRTLGGEPWVITRDGRAARIAKPLVIEELRATGVVVWLGTGGAATTGVPLTKNEKLAIPRVLKWRGKLPDGLRIVLVRFKDGGVCATTVGPKRPLPAEWMWRAWYLAAHAVVKAVPQ